MANERPKLNIPKTRGEWIWNGIGYFFFVGSVILLLFVWKSLPEKVPAHFDFSGEVNRWGRRWELWTLPGFGIFIGILMQILENYPQVYNFPQRFNESNAELFYLHNRKMLNQLKNICFIIFSLLLFESISIALDWGFELGVWLLPIVILGMGVPLVLGLIKQGKIK
ncbi:DUF1648 domain-containing protein [Cytobacillus sp. Hz8]|uniref:DUF1648 domain-containing protein n=1 Tax=Cytobacillus sp. Hz8 TaxID=3347168 RepID=UPI0035DAA321